MAVVSSTHVARLIHTSGHLTEFRHPNAMFTLAITICTDYRDSTSSTRDPFDIGPDLSIITTITLHFSFNPFIFFFHFITIFNFFRIITRKTGYKCRNI